MNFMAHFLSGAYAWERWCWGRIGRGALSDSYKINSIQRLLRLGYRPK